MTQRVWALTYSHRSDTDVSVHASLDAVHEARAEIVMNNLSEVSDLSVRRTIEEAYDNDDYHLCYRIYSAEVEDETLSIDESVLYGAEVKRPFIVVDSNSDLSHRVVTWPFGENTGVLMCGMEFLWQCPRTTEVACFMYLPREPPVLSCLQCIARETTK